MRTIKFSVWDPNLELMHYNIGLDKIHLYIFDGDNITEQEGLIIREWTGLTDRNGKEIYENDLVRNTDNQIFQVVWDELGWAIENKDNKYTGWVPERTEITGNIYEVSA